MSEPADPARLYYKKCIHTNTAWLDLILELVLNPWRNYRFIVDIVTKRVSAFWKMVSGVHIRARGEIDDHQYRRRKIIVRSSCQHITLRDINFNLHGIRFSLYSVYVDYMRSIVRHWVCAITLWAEYDLLLCSYLMYRCKFRFVLS